MGCHVSVGQRTRSTPGVTSKANSSQTRLCIWKGSSSPFRNNKTLMTTQQTPAPDRFLGRWLVSEYVYNPDGRFVGIIRQTRRLEQLAGGIIRVTQRSAPQLEVAQHPMAAFAGEWVFELTVEGRVRRYQGPDVLGVGLTWDEGVMTGRGVWPRFGHSFRSFAIMARPNCQITGGKFFNATEMIAHIVGIAMPEEAATTWPELGGPSWPGAIEPHWQGSLRRVSNMGIVQEELALRRTYTQSGWAETLDGAEVLALQFEPLDSRLRVTGSVTGIGKQAGWLLEIEAFTSSGVTLEAMEVLDSTRGHLVGIRRWLANDLLQQVETVQLSPI